MKLRVNNKKLRGGNILLMCGQINYHGVLEGL